MNRLGQNIFSNVLADQYVLMCIWALLNVLIWLMKSILSKEVFEDKYT